MSKATAPNALAMHIWINAIVMAVTLLTGACATRKDSVIPSTGPTMLEIYRKHMMGVEGNRSTQHEQDRGASSRELTAYTRTAWEEIESPFARLPNPDLVMYVFPHLSGDGAYPIPGYATVFPMYEGVEYALSGEVHSASVASPVTQIPTPADPSRLQRPDKGR